MVYLVFFKWTESASCNDMLRLFLTTRTGSVSYNDMVGIFYRDRSVSYNDMVGLFYKDGECALQ